MGNIFKTSSSLVSGFSYVAHIMHMPCMGFVQNFFSLLVLLEKNVKQRTKLFEKIPLFSIKQPNLAIKIR